MRGLDTGRASAKLRLSGNVSESASSQAKTETLTDLICVRGLWF